MTPKRHPVSSPEETGFKPLTSNSMPETGKNPMKNIIIIGMPGAGKSTMGVVLAKTLGRKFIDTDIVIQERAGKLLQDIIY